MLEMIANLVRTAGQKPAKHDAVLVDLFNDLKLRMRNSALRGYRHLLSMDRIAPD
jgi:hypothetical protein